MVATLTVQDRALDGTALGEATLEFLTERITVRELIRSHVYQGVAEENARRVTRWAELGRLAAKATLRDSERPVAIDWQPQFQRAIGAFASGALVIVVDGCQAESLDQEIAVRTDTTVSFLRLMPLVGG